MTRICLNMIVKNEAARIERCLASVAPHISSWAIRDTGSTDSTQQIILDFLVKSHPGSLFDGGFLNFAEARNAALDNAKSTYEATPYDYLLFMDADMELTGVVPGAFDELTAPAYAMLQRSNTLSYWNTRLLRRNVDARYVGVTHEYLSVPGAAPERLNGAWFRDYQDGANRPGKLERDVALLEGDIREKARSFYYLGQTQKDAGRPKEAALAYKVRSTLGGWTEETWHAVLSEARCQRDAGNEAAFIAGCLEAYAKRPTRAEPIYDLARFYREKPDMQETALMFAGHGLTISKPDDILFVEDYPYDWGFSEEISICGYYSKDPQTVEWGHKNCEELALSRDAPAATREQAWRNLFTYTPPLARLAPSLRTQRIDFTPPDGYHPCNPSVCQLRDKMYLNVRAVDYLIGQDGRYAIPADGNFVGRTRNFLFELHADLRIGKPVELKLPPSIPEAFAACLGFEDLRLFTDGSYLWTSATSRQHNAEGWCDIVTAVIDWRDGSMGAERILQPEGERRQQKNWMPIIDGSGGFIYSCDPVRILDLNGQTVSSRVPPIAADQWGGSSQAIPFTLNETAVTRRQMQKIAVDSGYLCLIHERQAYPDPMRGQRNYQRRFVWFDADFNIRRISRRFFFGDGEGEFVCGMCWHPDGQRLVISYGVLDREAWLATVDANEVRAMLREVGDGGDGRDRLGVPDTPAASDHHRDGRLDGNRDHNIGDNLDVGADPDRHRLEDAASGRFGIFSDHAPQISEPIPPPGKLFDELSATTRRAFPNRGPDLWLDRNTNAVLRAEADLAFAIDAVKANSWPVHPDPTKNWDCYIALRHVLKHANLRERILDAGSDHISSFLPTLKQIGYTDITGININEGTSLHYESGIWRGYGDIEDTRYPDNHFAFIACLSTIEHGVNVPKFLAEAVRILKPGGYLFISTDFWETGIDTRIPGWRILSPRDILDLVDEANRLGLFIIGEASPLHCEERVCHHARLDYTFINLLFRKGI